MNRPPGRHYSLGTRWSSPAVVALAALALLLALLALLLFGRSWFQLGDLRGEKFIPAAETTTTEIGEPLTITRVPE
ncbi:MAG: hypothetical protein ACKVWR_12365 [Acidimicrobiales bacterium]